MNDKWEWKNWMRGGMAAATLFNSTPSLLHPTLERPAASSAINAPSSVSSAGLSLARPSVQEQTTR